MIIPAIAIVAVFLAAWAWGRVALRWALVVAIFLSPMRGGLLALGNHFDLSDPGLTVNALVPAIIAGIALGVIVFVRPDWRGTPKPLLIGWALFAFVAFTDILFQTVGLKLYAVGLAQYLVYPTMAIAIWPLFEPGDLRRGVQILIAAGTVVALTVMLQATGLESFIQAATSQVDGLAAGRFAGITGSYLHTSAFLGTCAVLTMGEFLVSDSRRRQAVICVILAALLSGLNLTFSRSGVMISLIGAATLFLFAARGNRARFVLIGLVPAMIVALIIGTLGGVTPTEATNRVGSGLSPSADKGNELRSTAIQDGFDQARSNPLKRKIFGEGLAYTGNARQLVGGDVLAVESYYVKLLLEVGILGLLLIGAFLVWAGYRFASLAISRAGPTAASVGAAGLGLSLYNIIYPALETQILSMAWWLLLVLCLWSRREDPADPDSA